jgi:hypothetical protein
MMNDDSLGNLDDASVLDVRGCGLQEEEGLGGDLVAELFGVSAIVPTAARRRRVRAQVERRGRGGIEESPANCDNLLSCFVEVGHTAE